MTRRKQKNSGNKKKFIFFHSNYIIIIDRQTNGLTIGENKSSRNFLTFICIPSLKVIFVFSSDLLMSSLLSSVNIKEIGFLNILYQNDSCFNKLFRILFLKYEPNKLIKTKEKLSVTRPTRYKLSTKLKCKIIITQKKIVSLFLCLLRNYLLKIYLHLCGQQTDVELCCTSKPLEDYLNSTIKFIFNGGKRIAETFRK